MVSRKALPKSPPGGGSFPCPIMPNDEIFNSTTSSTWLSRTNQGWDTRHWLQSSPYSITSIQLGQFV